MRKLFILGFVAIVFLSCNNKKEESPKLNKAEIEKELWKAIEARFYSWRDNNYDAHMETYHPHWRRWSLTSKKLLKKEGFINLWDYVKKNEEVIEMELEPIEFTIMGNGETAIVHFVSKETFKWIGPSEPSIYGEYMEKDSIYTGTLRWSDVLVKVNGKWQCIGGHRDKSQLKNSLSK
ncbi:hypothetical protein WIW50_09800 [Flavobacteriaceae bacterium 3-367]|uniref:hypothetical protein n=1 Tax=Eudoraea algarum TaxID=3417568 RepID=UPI003287E5C9